MATAGSSGAGERRKKDDGTVPGPSGLRSHSKGSIVGKPQHPKMLPHEERELKNLMKRKKLILLVDLDETILHCKIDRFQNARAELQHFEICGLKYHIKFRPGVIDMLTALKSFYDLYICTKARPMYAQKTLELIDPAGNLFKKPIMSRMGKLNKKQMLEIYLPSKEQVVVAIDDRPEVWNQLENLVQVDPFVYFITPQNYNERKGEINGVKVDLCVQGANYRPRFGFHRNRPQPNFVYYGEEQIDDSFEQYTNKLYTYLVDIHIEFYKHYRSTGTMDVVRSIRIVKNRQPLVK